MDIKKIYALDSWVLFLIILVPFVLKNTFVGDVLSVFVSTLGLIWFYKLTSDLYKRLPGGHFMNLNKFRFHFFFPVTYVIIIMVTLGGYNINSNNMGEYGALGLVLMVLHFFSFYCLFYCLYFTSKTLISVYNNEKQVEFSSYIGSFLGFFFILIGIWFIQPKIRTIFSRAEPDALTE